VLFDGPLMETSAHKAHSRKLTIVRLVASWASVDMLLSLEMVVVIHDRQDIFGDL
jgi:hypothetical protein